ncbi:MAG: hypothetical protein LBV53_01515 [Mycoplasmataceae bacterium]|jgi:hypothetical protein|nr:hypothetical protein [Mycoplasmataceae bacterium]
MTYNQNFRLFTFNCQYVSRNVDNKVQNLTKVNINLSPTEGFIGDLSQLVKPITLFYWFGLSEGLNDEENITKGDIILYKGKTYQVFEKQITYDPKTNDKLFINLKGALANE